MTRGRGKGKRKAVSPTGVVLKDFRHESESEEEDGIQWESVGPPKVNQTPMTQSIVEKLNKIAHEKSLAGSHKSQKGPGSIIDLLNERASQRGSVVGGSQRGTSEKNEPKPTNMGKNPLFKTAKPEGCMRDVNIVEIRSAKEVPFTGTRTYKEATECI